MDCLTSDLRSAIDEVKMDLCAEIFVDILTETINSDIMKDLFMEQSELSKTNLVTVKPIMPFLIIVTTLVLSSSSWNVWLIRLL